MKAIVRTAAAGRSRLGNAQVASPTLAAQSAPLLARERSSEPYDPIGMKAQVGAERLYAETQPGPAPPGAIASGRLRKSDGHAGEPRPTTASSAGACNQTDRS